jgi:hypothetical protein
MTELMIKSEITIADRIIMILWMTITFVLQTDADSCESDLDGHQADTENEIAI